MKSWKRFEKSSKHLNTTKTRNALQKTSKHYQNVKKIYKHCYTLQKPENDLEWIRTIYFRIIPTDPPTA